METLLFLAHTNDAGTLDSAALEALNAALSLKASLGNASLIASLIGADVQSAASQIASAGISRFLGVSGADFAQSRYATDALAVETLVKTSGATLVVAPGTSRFARCLAGVAQRVGGRADTHITGMDALNGKVSVTRWYYRQRMEAVLSRSQRPWFLLNDPGSCQAWSGPSGKASVETADVLLPETVLRTKVTGLRVPASDAQTIRPDAKLLFVAGAGWTKKQPDGRVRLDEAGKLILDFLKRTRSSLGSSKSLVDLGGEGQSVLPFLSHLNQIGQTGATPRHPKGLSTCCHGEEPHTVGWRFITERRAISLDPGCGWARGKADVLYVADAFKVMAKLNEILGEKG